MSTTLAERATKRWTQKPAVRGGATATIGGLSIGLLVWMAPPGKVLEQIGRMNATWVMVAVGLELASCLSYVIIFRYFFPEPPRASSRRVAWLAMGAGAVLPGGNISSAAATGLLLHRQGVGTRALIRRCAALLCLLTAFGFTVNGIAGLLLLAGVPDGPLDLSHDGGPILVSAVVLGAAVLVVLLTRRFGKRTPQAIRGIAAGLEGAWTAAKDPNWRLVGAAGFFCLDMAALWAACAATGHWPGFLAVLIAYCIGYLATAVPIPAGIGVLDSGLAGALVLYGLPPTAAVGAVLVYRAISIWIPGLGAVIAWISTWRAEATPGRAGVSAPLRGFKLAEATDTDR